MRMTIVVFTFAVAIVGCSAGDHGDTADWVGIARESASSTAPADSAMSMDVLLQRFQNGLPRTDTLSATAPNRPTLTRRYLQALANFDTSALRALHITRAEYAYLYFPSSKMMKPPYELPPDAAWLLHTSESNKGIGSMMRRFGGRRLQFENVRCPGEPLREGSTTVWRGCLVRYRVPGEDAKERPLFAAIIERDGRVKFFSYATPL